VSLPKELKSSPFTNRRANRLGVSAHDLALLVDQGQIDLIARGVYIAFQKKNNFKRRPYS
jgi:hypothetical protein